MHEPTRVVVLPLTLIVLTPSQIGAFQFHASKAAEGGRGRRVLQLDYSADDLPGGLTWAGI